MKLSQLPPLAYDQRARFVYANELIRKSSPLDSLPLVSLHVIFCARRMNQKESHLPLQYMDLRIVVEWVNRRAGLKAIFARALNIHKKSHSSHTRNCCDFECPNKRTQRLCTIANHWPKIGIAIKGPNLQSRSLIRIRWHQIIIPLPKSSRIAFILSATQPVFVSRCRITSFFRQRQQN